MTTAMHLFEGEQGRIEAIDVKPDQDICEVNGIAIEAIRRLDDGSGVLVLTDVLGGTPSNCCHQLSAENKVQVLTGVSLPMYSGRLHIGRTIWKRLSKKLCPEEKTERFVSILAKTAHRSKADGALFAGKVQCIVYKQNFRPLAV